INQHAIYHHFNKNNHRYGLTLASNAGRGGLNSLGGLSLGSSGLLLLQGGLVGDLLGLLDSLVGVLGSLDGSITLSFAELRLLVSLSEDRLERGVSDTTSGSGNLLVGASLLGVLLTVDSLLVLAPVKNGPGNVTRVSLQLVRSHTLSGQEDIDLKAGSDSSLSVSGMDLVAGKDASFQLHVGTPEFSET
ncbi:hypothetical protein PMAYCL1PPCAC_23544, partial [Pristionchus mayeri]